MKNMSISPAGNSFAFTGGLQPKNGRLTAEQTNVLLRKNWTIPLGVKKITPSKDHCHIKVPNVFAKMKKIALKLFK